MFKSIRLGHNQDVLERESLENRKASVNNEIVDGNVRYSFNWALRKTDVKTILESVSKALGGNLWGMNQLSAGRIDSREPSTLY